MSPEISDGLFELVCHVLRLLLPPVHTHVQYTLTFDISHVV